MHIWYMFEWMHEFFQKLHLWIHDFFWTILSFGNFGNLGNFREFWGSLVILEKPTGNKYHICKCFLKKSQFLSLLLNISLEWSPLYYYSQSCGFNDLWTNDSPHFFLLFVFFSKLHYFFKGIKEIFDFLFLENAYMIYVWMNAWIFSENALMNTWFFFNAYIVHVWKIFSKRKYFYECMISFWMHIWCMFEWFFFFVRKCIYEILDFFFLKMHDFFWMHI